MTTLVDAGTAGADTFLREKQEVIDHAKVRVLAFLNIVADGMEGGTEQDVSRMNVQFCAETVQKFPEIIVGVKTAHYWTEKPWDAEHPPWAAVDRAEECGRLASVPVMVDFWPRDRIGLMPTSSWKRCGRAIFTRTCSRSNFRFCSLTASSIPF